jgi:hypothetical protein
MAEMNPAKKADIAPGVYAALRRHGMRGTLSCARHNTLVCNITEGSLDLIGNFNNVLRSRIQPIYLNAMTARDHMVIDPHWWSEQFDGEPLNFLRDLVGAMTNGDHNDSDFDLDWYIAINVGRPHKPYRLVSRRHLDQGRGGAQRGALASRDCAAVPSR